MTHKKEKKKHDVRRGRSPGAEGFSWSLEILNMEIVNQNIFFHCKIFKIFGIKNLVLDPGPDPDMYIN